MTNATISQDIELGDMSSGVPTQHNARNRRQCSIKKYIKALFRGKATAAQNAHQPQIEDYRPGYPRLSALIGADSSFHICRRFSTVRARLLLLKQDKISQLEQQLEQADRAEQATLFLSCNRRDQNSERLTILEELDKRLADYDAFLKRGKEVLDFDLAAPRSVLSLQNWIKNTACLARNEREFLTRGRDLITLSPAKESGVEAIEHWFEDCLISAADKFQKGPNRSISRDSNVYIFTNKRSATLARFLISTIVVTFLLAPVLVCNSLKGEKGRMLVVAFATILLITVLSVLSKARMVEMFIAGTAYATVLIVFVSGAHLDSGSS